MSNSLYFCKVNETVKSPVRGHFYDAGIDFFVPANFNDGKNLTVEPNNSVLVNSGIKVNVPEGYALVAKNKSGVALKKHLSVGGCVVDTGYLGEIVIHLYNFGTEPIDIIPNEKIVQFVMFKIGNQTLEEIPEDDFIQKFSSERGEGKFGSTGV